MEFLARLNKLFGGQKVFNINFDLFPSNEFSDDDDDDDNIRFGIERRQYRMYPRMDYMEMWNNDEFFKRFRLSKPTVAYILTLIEPQLKPKGADICSFIVSIFFK